MENIKYSREIFTAQIDKATVESTRKIKFVIASEATGKEHRNRFIYNWSNWKLDNYNSNGIVGYQHNLYGSNMCLAPNPDDVIAKSTAWVDTFQGKRVLMSEAEFEPKEINETAEKVFQKIIFGSLNAASTGIDSTGPIKTDYVKNEKNEIVDYYLNFPGQELLEWSIVNIPADAAALKRSMKSHTMAALQFVQRLIEDRSLSDIKKMNVQEILDSIEGKYTSAPITEIEKELTGPDPNLDKYLKMQSNLKNGQIKK